MLLSATVRLWAPARMLFTAMLDKNFPTYHLVMGVVHGLTNLGGAMLAILASTTNNDKRAIRNTVAHYYLLFSGVQMLILVIIMGQRDVFIVGVPTAAISAAIYLVVGNRIFSRTDNKSYNMALTMFIAIFGVVVLLRA